MGVNVTNKITVIVQQEDRVLNAFVSLLAFPGFFIVRLPVEAIEVCFESIVLGDGDVGVFFED